MVVPITVLLRKVTLVQQLLKEMKHLGSLNVERFVVIRRIMAITNVIPLLLVVKERLAKYSLVTNAKVEIHCMVIAASKSVGTVREV
jgi:hypothetical protein